MALVLNLTTGLVLPQYHVVFDDTFLMVASLRQKKEPSNWEQLCKHHTEDYRMAALPNEEKTATDLSNEFADWMITDDHSDTEDTTTFGDVMVDELDATQQHAPTGLPSDEPTPWSTTREGEDTPAVQFDLAQNTIHEFDPSLDDDDDMSVGSQADQPQQVSEGATQDRRRSPSIPLVGTRSSKRSPTPSHKLLNQENRRLKKALGLVTVCLLGLSGTVASSYLSVKKDLDYKLTSYQARMINYKEVVDLNADGSLNQLHPLSLISNQANEAFHFHQAMQEDDREQFVESMIKELNDHKKNNHWKLVLHKDIGGAKTVKAIWAFKRKRRPDGSLLKHKARLNAHGGMQIYGESYWDTYAPVVNWISIRMMLTLSVIHELYTTSIDFTLAFPQADVETTIYMEVPLGCCVPEGDYVCLLLKNLYGLKQAARTWFECLRDTLVADVDKNGLGFKQSMIDPCIFYRNGVILISWVDDCLIFAKDKLLADELIAELQGQFTLTEEEDVSAYLGVMMDIDKEKDCISMTQPFLIQRIIDLLGDSVSEANVKKTPAVYKEILHKDEEGPERRQSWNYRSAIGMLNYLSASTRADLAFAVHQCARFSANPKLSHERALKRIVRYLKGTKDKGIILSPDPKKGITCYVDADFAGGYCNETKDHPISVYSRTGYVLVYFGCPLIWVSKLQSEISLSTVEAEYVALSQAMRDVIPFIDLVKEMDGIFDYASPKVDLHCTLFEDNNGALELAMKPRYRPRTKHIAIKYHHFRDHVTKGMVTVKPIDTAEQLADQFTKGLQEGTFVYLRHKLLGW